MNRHEEQIDAAVTNLNGTDIFLGYNQLVKYNPELNWDMRTIWFTRYPKTYRTQYQDIIFRMRRAQAMETSDKEQLKIDKKLDPTNLEDLPEYI